MPESMSGLLRCMQSKRAARELLASDAIRVNGEKVTAEQNDLGFALFDQYWILQKGKKHFALLKR